MTKEAKDDDDDNDRFANTDCTHQITLMLFKSPKTWRGWMNEHKQWYFEYSRGGEEKAFFREEQKIDD